MCVGGCRWQCRCRGVFGVFFLFVLVATTAFHWHSAHGIFLSRREKSRLDLEILEKDSGLESWIIYYYTIHQSIYLVTSLYIAYLTLGSWMWCSVVCHPELGWEETIILARIRSLSGIMHATWEGLYQMHTHAFHDH